jgi:hypothetical protein
MTLRELEEYRALRDTIRERGTARHWIVVFGFGVWAALTLGAVALVSPPVATLLPLLVLVVVFEVIFAIHTGVERVGRYVQVYFEAAEETARWEQVAMAYGRAYGGGGIDALFTPVFWTAALLNFIPAMLSGPAAIDWVVVGAVHALFIVRVGSARRQAGRQRAVDLERFSRLKADQPREDQAETRTASRTP